MKTLKKNDWRLVVITSMLPSDTDKKIKNTCQLYAYLVLALIMSPMAFLIEATFFVFTLDKNKFFDKDIRPATMDSHLFMVILASLFLCLISFGMNLMMEFCFTQMKPGSKFLTNEDVNCLLYSPLTLLVYSFIFGRIHAIQKKIKFKFCHPIIIEE